MCKDTHTLVKKGKRLVMESKSDRLSVLEIPGLRKDTGLKLARAGILYMDQLFTHQGAVQGCDIENIKQKAKALMPAEKVPKADWRTTKHAWFGMRLLRLNHQGIATSCHVYELVVEKGGIYFMVGKQTATKRVSGAMLLLVLQQVDDNQLYTDADMTRIDVPTLFKVDEVPPADWQVKALALWIQDIQAIQGLLERKQASHAFLYH